MFFYLIRACKMLLLSAIVIVFLRALIFPNVLDIFLLFLLFLILLTMFIVP
ncbi:MAG: hypothetical protein ACXVP5_09415 [Tumebacillaceae bacterium]